MSDALKTKITEDMVIGDMVKLKGLLAAVIFNDMICGGGGGCRCKTSLTIGFAASKMGAQDKVPELLQKLSDMSDDGC